MSDCRVVRACLTPEILDRLASVMESESCWMAVAESSQTPAAESRTGGIRVHSVFRRVVNLTAGGRMLSLADESLGDMPDTLYLPAEWMDLLQNVREKEWVIAGNGVLAVGGFLIRLPADMGSPMEGYTPKPRNEGWAERLLEACESEKKESALKRLPDSWRTRVRTALEDYTRALRRGENGRKFAEQILGLGPGATPAADDAILAITAMLWPAPVHFPDAMLARTSAISAKYLNCGQEGYYARMLTELLDDPTPERAHAVAACGATSGADMLYGLRTACRVQLCIG